MTDQAETLVGCGLILLTVVMFTWPRFFAAIVASGLGILLFALCINGLVAAIGLVPFLLLCLLFKPRTA